MAKAGGRARMPTSPIGRVSDLHRSTQAGFTLIELLIVISIISVLSVGAVLAVGGRPNDATAARLAEQLVGDIQSARDQAILGRTLWGVRTRPDGWQIVRQTPDGAWVDGNRPRVQAEAVLTWQVEHSGQTRPETPPILIAPEGRMSAFSLTLRMGGLFQRCSTDGHREVTCSAP